MVTPRTRSEFERNFNLLRQQIIDGKFRISIEGEGPIDGIEKVRYLPNGRIDFLSVDENARLNANMISQFSEGGMFQEMQKLQENSNDEEHSDD